MCGYAVEKQASPHTMHADVFYVFVCIVSVYVYALWPCGRLTYIIGVDIHGDVIKQNQSEFEKKIKTQISISL